MKPISRRQFLTRMSAVPLAANSISRINSIKSKPVNMLWIAVEDISPFLSCYGFNNNTPNIDKLAAEGIQFNNAFMPAPVCSACRSGLITGMMPTTIGCHNHHSSRTSGTALKLPPGIDTLPEIFRRAGYFTFNQGKDDYNFWYDREELYSGEYVTHPLYGKSGKREIGWKDARPGQHFFGQIQLYGGKHIYSKSFHNRVTNPVDRATVKLPPYYPDHPEIREDWAQHLDSIRITDAEVGQIVQQLKKDGLYENTAIVFFSDHGMRLWRHKQFCYDSSLHVPFIIKTPGITGGVIRKDLINGLDIAATSLGLAGLDIPAYMESKNLLDKDYNSRDHVISVRDRCDYTIDRIRTVRTKKYRYIRNFYPDRPYMQPNYRDEWQVTNTIRRLYAEGKLDDVQARFWEKARPAEELYDIANDPHEIHNLADSGQHRDILLHHRQLLTSWICQTGDLGQYPEDVPNLKYIYDFWMKKGVEPVNPEYDRFRTK